MAKYSVGYCIDTAHRIKIADVATWKAAIELCRDSLVNPPENIFLCDVYGFPGGTYDMFSHRSAIEHLDFLAEHPELNHYQPAGTANSAR